MTHHKKGDDLPTDRGEGAGFFLYRYIKRAATHYQHDATATTHKPGHS